MRFSGFIPAAKTERKKHLVFILNMVNSVQLSSDVYLVCLSHALSTEREEVMGLLLGEVRVAGCD